MTSGTTLMPTLATQKTIKVKKRKRLKPTLSITSGQDGQLLGDKTMESA
jgi:hypothetical protein